MLTNWTEAWASKGGLKTPGLTDDDTNSKAGNGAGLGKGHSISEGLWLQDDSLSLHATRSEMKVRVSARRWNHEFKAEALHVHIKEIRELEESLINVQM
jgi:hypothetical protein